VNKRYVTVKGFAIKRLDRLKEGDWIISYKNGDFVDDTVKSIKKWKKQPSVSIKTNINTECVFNHTNKILTLKKFYRGSSIREGVKLLVVYRVVNRKIETYRAKVEQVKDALETRYIVSTEKGGCLIINGFIVNMEPIK
jgi:hypothetical protein